MSAGAKSSEWWQQVMGKKKSRINYLFENRYMWQGMNANGMPFCSCDVLEHDGLLTGKM